jgi:hypothetical protein
MLASYAPADAPPSTSRLSFARRLRDLARRGDEPASVRKPAKARPDYQGREFAWTGGVLAHSFNWIREACHARNLEVRQSRQDTFGIQVWLEIKPREVATAG